MQAVECDVDIVGSLGCKCCCLGSRPVLLLRSEGVRDGREVLGSPCAEAEVCSTMPSLGAAVRRWLGLAWLLPLCREEHCYTLSL